VITPAAAAATSVPVAAWTARPATPPIRTLLTTASAPAMVKNWYQAGLDTPACAAMAAGVSGLGGGW